MALRESEERYALAAEGTNDGLWDWELKEHRIYFSPRWKAMLGYADYEIKPNLTEWFERIHPDDLQVFSQQLKHHLDGDYALLQAEYRIRHRNGSYRWVLCRGIAIRNGKGKPYRVVGSQGDITDRKQAEERLRRDALYDKLTNLPNRTLFMERLEALFKQAKNCQSYKMGIIFLDLNRFKLINDSLGHQAGDKLLIIVARRLEKAVRDQDLVARLAGDEFTILLDGFADIDEIDQISSRIKTEMVAPIDLSGQTIFVTVSIGVVFYKTDYESAEALLNEADIAMYADKNRHRRQSETYKLPNRQQAIARLQLESDLWQATDRNQIEIYYQPIVSLLNGTITGVEALLRWNHPQLGEISPKEFIPIAEETGLIVPIGDWLIDQAVKQLSHWHQIGHKNLRLAINISANQFHQHNLLPILQMVLAETKVPPTAIELEITETVALKDSILVLETLKQIRAMGVRIAIDDFGLGSSLEHLKLLPLDSLKIDQAFVRGMIKEGYDAAIITAIISMAHSLNLKVIAEGVETAFQVAFLRRQQCDEIQGYLCSPPLSATDILDKLNDAPCLAPEPLSEELKILIQATTTKNRKMAYALVDERLVVTTYNSDIERWVDSYHHNRNLVGLHLLDIFPEIIGLEDYLHEMLFASRRGLTVPKIHRPSPDGFGYYFDLQIEPFLETGPNLLVATSDVTDQARLELDLRQERNELRLKIREFEKDDKYAY
ncbi:EAL domain-containing protein [Anaerolineales bacterium HSG24]|nr:EAL domain-containing protein [Anaerolineales bacterium HSG24]